jgi:hypothetical protein
MFTTLPPIAILILMVSGFTGCDSNSEKATTNKNNKAPYTIRLAEAENKKGEVLLSDFAKSITYVGLESNKEHLIGGNARLYLAGDYIIAIAFRQIYVFDKTDGTFVKEIMSYGNGPDQYRNTIPMTHINETSQVVYATNPKNERIGLDVNGTEQLKFNVPSSDSTFVGSCFPLGTDLYVGFHSNYDCNQNLKLIIFNQNGEVVKTFKNGSNCINEYPDRISFNTTEGAFYEWDKDVFFKEAFNDTLYQVNQESLDIHAVFANDEFALPYSKKTALLTSEDMAPYFNIKDIDETEGFIFFSFDHKGEKHSAFYNKSSNETRVAFDQESDLNQFTNDLDDFIPFSPLYATADGKLVGYLEAPYVVEWFEMNPEKAARLPAALKRFENMNEYDNPVLMIVDTKD